MTAKRISPVLWLVFAILAAGCGSKLAGPQDTVAACQYRLPFNAETGDYITTQANLSAIAGWSHAAGKPAQYAFDFAIPNGTAVLAARAGTVSAVSGGSTNCGGPDKAEFANFVIVDHGDGTFAYYGHLRPEIPVEKGDKVKQGQMLGSSGNSGYTDCGSARSTGYHLHFQLQATGENFAASIPTACFEGVEGEVPQQGTVLLPGPGEIPEIGGYVVGQGGTAPPSNPKEEMLIGAWEGVITAAPTSIGPNMPEQVRLEVSRSGDRLVAGFAHHFDTSYEYEDPIPVYQTEDPSYWPDSDGWYSFWEEGAETQPLPTEYVLRPVDQDHLELALSGTDMAVSGILQRISGNQETGGQPSSPLDSRNVDSVVEWLSYALGQSDISVFEQLASDQTISLGSGFAGGRFEISRSEFLEMLRERIGSGAVCRGYSGDNEYLMVWTSGWNPHWEDGRSLGPWATDELVLSFFNSGSGLSLATAYGTPSVAILEVIEHNPCPGN